MVQDLQRIFTTKYNTKNIQIRHQTLASTAYSVKNQSKIEQKIEFTEKTLRNLAGNRMYDEGDDTREKVKNTRRGKHAGKLDENYGKFDGCREKSAEDAEKKGEKNTTSTDNH